jgi:hypothetical protein
VVLDDIRSLVEPEGLSLDVAHAAPANALSEVLGDGLITDRFDESTSHEGEILPNVPDRVASRFFDPFKPLPPNPFASFGTRRHLSHSAGPKHQQYEDHIQAEVSSGPHRFSDDSNPLAVARSSVQGTTHKPTDVKLP